MRQLMRCDNDFCDCGAREVRNAASSSSDSLTASARSPSSHKELAGSLATVSNSAASAVCSNVMIGLFLMVVFIGDGFLGKRQLPTCVDFVARMRVVFGVLERSLLEVSVQFQRSCHPAEVERLRVDADYESVLF